MQEDTQSTPSPTPDALGAATSGAPSPAPAPSPSPSLDVDPQIIEALRSKDRIYVLKLGETFEALIMERRQRVEISPTTSYQRLLVHRCSAYYKLAPESDPVTKGIFVLTTAESRIPDRRISELVPAESTTQPAFKIMRRSVLDRRSKPQSLAGSVAGEDQELSDHEQSESGSLGGQSSATNSSNKKRMTIAEREAAYNEARSRIFMDFEEKSKEKDMSASSSTHSLNGSASTSAGGRSSLGDTEDAVSSPATESEWSVPSGSNSRDKRDGRRGGPNSASASSSRSLRNPGAFHGNGSGGSSRNSRAASPSSFSYASLHDNPVGGHIYDPSHPNPMPSYYPAQYAYPYPPPAQGPAPPFVPQYQYYPHHYNAYQSPPPVPQHTTSDPTTPASAEPYSPPHMGYMPPYGWPPHPQQPPIQSPPPHTMHVALPPTQPPQNSQPVGPAPAHPPHPQHPQYHPYPAPVHAYSYPMGAYYPPQPPPPNGQQQMPPPPPPPSMPAHQQQHPPQPSQQPHYMGQPQPQPQHMHQPPHAQPPQQQQQNLGEYGPRGSVNNNAPNHPPPHGHYNSNNNHNGPRNGLGNGVISMHSNNNSRGPSRNGSGGPGMNNGNGNGGGYNGGGGNNNNKHQRGPPPPPSSQRSAWSYGPGISQGPGLYTPMPHSAADTTVGPRLNISRRTSGNSSSGSNSRASSNCDEVSSTSSTTSSSSRRTYTSTTSSQHPLPPRPDWAVGLKAQPTLAGGPRHHDISSRGISPISPPRMSSNGHNSPIGRMGSSNSNSNNDGVPRVTLESQDFPPLTTTGGEKRTPVVTGAWGNARPVLSPSMNVNVASPGAQQQQQNGATAPPLKQEENDVAKATKPNFRDAVKNESPNPVAGLAGQVAAMSLEGNGAAASSAPIENGVGAVAATVPSVLPVVDGGSTVVASPAAAATTAV